MSSSVRQSPRSTMSNTQGDGAVEGGGGLSTPISKGGKVVRTDSKTSSMSSPRKEGTEERRVLTFDEGDPKGSTSRKSLMAGLSTAPAFSSDSKQKSMSTLGMPSSGRPNNAAQNFKSSKSLGGPAPAAGALSRRSLHDSKGSNASFGSLGGLSRKSLGGGGSSGGSIARVDSPGDAGGDARGVLRMESSRKSLGTVGEGDIKRRASFLSVGREMYSLERTEATYDEEEDWESMDVAPSGEARRNKDGSCRPSFKQRLGELEDDCDNHMSEDERDDEYVDNHDEEEEPVAQTKTLRLSASAAASLLSAQTVALRADEFLSAPSLFMVEEDGNSAHRAMAKTRSCHTTALNVIASVSEHKERLEERTVVMAGLRTWAHDVMVTRNPTGSQVFEFIDAEQLDFGDKKKHRPDKTGVGAQLRGHWQSTVNEEVESRIEKVKAQWLVENASDADELIELRKEIKTIRESNYTYKEQFLSLKDTIEMLQKKIQSKKGDKSLEPGDEAEPAASSIAEVQGDDLATVIARLRAELESAETAATDAAQVLQDNSSVWEREKKALLQELEEGKGWEAERAELQKQIAVAKEEVEAMKAQDPPPL